MHVRRQHRPRQTYKFFKHTGVKLVLILSAVPQLMVVLLQTLPMCLKLLHAVGVDVFYSVSGTSVS